VAFTVVTLGNTGGSASQTAQTHATTNDIAIGDLVIFGLIGNNTGATFSGSDASSNSYSTVTDGNGNSSVADIAYCVATAAMTSGGLFTATSSAARVAGITGLRVRPPAGTTATVKDVEATPLVEVTSVTSWVTNTSGATSQDSEVAIGLWLTGGSPTITPTGGSTAHPDGPVVTSGTVRRGLMQYKELVAIGTQQATATASGANSYIGLLVTFLLQVDVWPPVDTPPAPPLRVGRSNLRLA
jgi:hypothetical protein